jgi:hypothetical protein
MALFRMTLTRTILVENILKGTNYHQIDKHQTVSGIKYINTCLKDTQNNCSYQYNTNQNNTNQNNTRQN